MMILCRGASYDLLLRYVTINNSYDIVKVYKPNICSLEGTFENCNDSNLIWEQEQEVGWLKVPINTKILVKNNINTDWYKRYFAKYENGKVYAFANGCTSWSAEGDYVQKWEYAKLAKED